MSNPIEAPMPAVRVIDTRSVAKGTRLTALRKLRLVVPVLLLAALGLWLCFHLLAPA